MEIVLNGARRQVPDNLSLEELLHHLNLKSERVAVERNREIVKREQWALVRVQGGDELEIVHFVGGGRRCLPIGRRPCGNLPSERE